MQQGRDHPRGGLHETSPGQVARADGVHDPVPRPTRVGRHQEHVGARPQGPHRGVAGRVVPRDCSHVEGVGDHEPAEAELVAEESVLVSAGESDAGTEGFSLRSAM